ncbi:DUF6082 family protein [Streptomyces scopuliridis]|uniref:DUF6082 family protein n=1 Tax=Streptomyces scopuliridis TaxID=452529 RepID=UPI003679E3E1
MKPLVLSGAILTAAAVGAAHVVIGVRQHRDQCALATADMHARLMADQESRPSRTAMWASQGTMTEEQRVRGLHCNRWFVLWTLQHRLGVVPSAALRHVADDFMQHPQNAEFWGRARDTWTREIRDKTDRRLSRFSTRRTGRGPMTRTSPLTWSALAPDTPPS